MDLQPGSFLGPYEVRALLGAGGMGVVYRARDGRLGREVAVKVLPRAFFDSPERLSRFQQEARTAGSLNHPNLVAVYDVGEHEGAPYLVMELLEGQSLRQWMGERPVPVRRAVEIAQALADGLSAVHARGIVHRDLKPENVFVARDGRVKILDFGLAKPAPSPSSDADSTQLQPLHVSETGQVVGTTGYMSPEQVRGEKLDGRSDLFSLGVVLWEMVTGARPFLGTSAVETMHAILTAEPPPLDPGLKVPPVLEKVLHTCLAKEAAQRFHSAHDLAFALGTLSNASSGSSPDLARPAPARRPWRLAALGLLAALALAGAGWAATRRPASAFPTFKRITFAKGFIQGAFFVPGSRELVFAAGWRGQDPEVHTLNPEALESRPTGIRPKWLQSVSRNLDLVLQEPQGLVVASLGGGGKRPLPPGLELAAFDSEGRLAAVLKDGGGWVVQWPLGTERHRSERAIETLFACREAPRIAFTEDAASDKGRVSVLHVLEAQGPARKVVTLDGLENLYWAWGPKGREIWASAYTFGSDQSEFRAYGLDGKVRVLFRGAGHLQLADVDPDGRVLVDLCNGRVEIHARAPGEATEKDLSWFDGSALLSLSRDGRRIFFQDRWKGGMAGGGYVRGTTGGPAVRVFEGNFWSVPCLAPNGTYLNTTLYGDWTRLVRVALDGGENQTCRLKPEGPPLRIWTAGDRLLLACMSPELGTRWAKAGAVVPWKEGAVPLFTFPGEADAMSMVDNPVSPDGSTFFWIRTDRAQPRAEIRSMADGKVLHELALEGSEGQSVAGWSPDGRALLLASFRYRTIDLLRLEISTGRRTKVQELRVGDPSGAAGVMNFLAAGDGSSYAYTLLRKSSELYLVEGLK